MFAIGRRKLLLGATALGVAGCNQTSTGGSGGSAASGDEIGIGQANAPVTLIEYASAMCPHCKEFHDEAWERLKQNYLDTGKVRFVLREMLTPAQAAPIALAAFQVARCGNATPEQYINRVDEFYAQQNAIYNSGSMEGVRQKMIEIGATAGLSEQQVMDCIGDTAGGSARTTRIAEAANRDFQVTGTPTFILNGKKVEDPPIPNYDQLAAMIDRAIAGH